ncbi:MAG TPA: hypothetical protein PKX55_14425 [Leptospiraceae bacterium]|nr:hypothetical protein [Leptospiraceae bacterium]HNK55315.1 hypothetical protein [Leptospiraceae bacterium]
MNDTSPEIESMLRKKYMSLSGWERVQIGSSMFDAAKKIVEYSLPKNLSEKEKKIQMFLRFYGHEFSEVEKQKIIERITLNLSG